VALNTTKYSLKDVFQTNTDTQNYTFGTVWSPRIGLSYKVGSGKNIYASVSKGFSVPAVAISVPKLNSKGKESNLSL